MKHMWVVKKVLALPNADFELPEQHAIELRPYYSMDAPITFCGEYMIHIGTDVGRRWWESANIRNLNLPKCERCNRVVIMYELSE